MLDRLDHQLGDPIPALDLVILEWVGVHQKDRHLAAIAGVNEARRVEAGDTMTQREATTGQDESSVPGWESDHDPGRNQGTSPARSEVSTLPGKEVCPGVA
jgi:hypothetical protein